MILVTGGAGYIGSHCVLALLKEGFEVVILDNLSTGHLETVNVLKSVGKERVKFINVDLLDIEGLNEAFDKDIEAVIHFAGFSQVAESVKFPQKYYTNNVVGTLNLLKVMTERGVDKIVFSSTASIYGEPVDIPIKETHPKNPLNPYGKTKLIIENILEDYGKSYGIRSVSLRYFNVIGADLDLRLGENHRPETHLVPNILKSTFSSGKIFEIYGNDYDTKDGTCVRDYVDVEDLSRAHILALKYLQKGGETISLNLGSGKGNTVGEIFNNCETITGTKIPYRIMARRSGDCARLVADYSLANKILGWKPEKPILESIRCAYEWEKSLEKEVINA